jgi:hypothetical protein
MCVPTVLSGISLPACRRALNGPRLGQGWLHEIKHDGFRIMARRNGDGVRLYTRNGYDFAGRFPQIVEAVSRLKVRSCFIDGEAIVVDERGLSAFDLLSSWRHDHAAVLCAFDLIEVDGGTCATLRSKTASMPWPGYCAGNTTASCSTSTMTVTAKLSLSTPARSAVRASCRSGAARGIARAASGTGSRSRTRQRPQ